MGSTEGHAPWPRKLGRLGLIRKQEVQKAHVLAFEVQQDRPDRGERFLRKHFSWMGIERQSPQGLQYCPCCTSRATRKIGITYAVVRRIGHW